MKEEAGEVTEKDLLELVQRQEGEFIIHIEPGGGETDEGAGTVQTGSRVGEAG